MSKAETYFRSRAPWLMGKLMGDFPLDVLDTAAIAGNGGHESGGFTILQEKNPTVKGSRGGYGWFQWTGPRRRAYEAYCERTGKDPASDEANYAWLFLELRGSERRAIDRVKAAVTLKDKVIAFEDSYERAGIKHHDKRLRWAEIALDAWEQQADERKETAGITIPAETGLAAIQALSKHSEKALASAAQLIALARSYQAGWRVAEPSRTPTDDSSKTGGKTLPNTKSIFQSKTLWGILTVVLAQFSPATAAALKLFIDVPDVDQSTIDQLTGAVNQLVTAGGTLLAFWGRLKADAKIKIPGVG